MNIVKTFICTILLLIVLDLIWIGYIGNSLYREGYGHLLRKTGDAISPNWYAAIIVYILYVMGIIFLIIPLVDISYCKAAIFGGSYGLILYGFYNFTNYAVFANWPLKIVIIDSIWGICLGTLLSLFAVFINNISL